MALDEVDATGRTFTELLRIAQIDAGTRRERFALMDMVALLDEVVQIYAEMARDFGKDLHWT